MKHFAIFLSVLGLTNAASEATTDGAQATTTSDSYNIPELNRIKFNIQRDAYFALDDMHKGMQYGPLYDLERLSRDIGHAQEDINRFWEQITWRANENQLNLQEDGSCAYCFQPGGQDTFAIDWTTQPGDECPNGCAIPYKADGQLNWDPMNEFYGIGSALQMLQYNPVLKQSLNLQESNIPWRELHDIEEFINFLGQDPSGLLDGVVKAVQHDLTKIVNDTNQLFTNLKNAVGEPVYDKNFMNLNEQEDQKDALDARMAEIEAAMGSGLNLQEGGEDVTEEEVMDLFKTGLQDLFNTTDSQNITEKLAAFNISGLNLEADVLPTPEWEISLDEAKGEQMATELTNDYMEWMNRFNDIMEGWKKDEELVNKYYWEFEMKPHLDKGAKLDEKTLRSLVTYIAESTTIKGKPMIEIFPEVQEAMMSNFDPNGPNIYEKFGMYNLQEISEEWFAADWELYQQCVADADFVNEAAETGCDWYDTFNNDFENCVRNYECDGWDAFMEKYPSGRVEETATIYLDDEHGSVEDQIADAEHDLINEIVQIEHRVEDTVVPRGGAVTYKLYFDEEMINAWIDKEVQMFSTLNRMYTSTMEEYLAALEVVNQEHAPKFAELDELFKNQVDDTLFDVNHYFHDNFSMEYPEEVSALSLAAKVESQHIQSKISNTDILMYAGVAVASLAVAVWQFKQAISKKDIADNDYFERLI